MPKNVQTIVQLCSFHMLIRLCSKSFKFGFSSMWRRTSICTSWVRKGRGTRDQIADICWIMQKVREFDKGIYFCFTDYAKAFDCVDHTNCGKFLKRWDYQTTLPASWEICMKVKKQQLELDMEQWSCSILGKDHVKAVYCHVAYLTYM